MIEIDFAKGNGLVPVIVQDVTTKEVLKTNQIDTAVQPPQ